MRFDTLPQIEERFRNEAGSTLTPFSVPVKDEDLTLHGKVYKPNRSDYFFAVEHPKLRIVLHFTAGNVRSDMQSLTTQGRHVSTAFVIGRDGTVYNLFPSKFWSGHLGAGIGNGAGTGNPQDKATIGIEISNYGFLVPKGDALETIYSRIINQATGKPNPVDQYCLKSNTNAFSEVPSLFRGQQYFASFTPAQLDNLIILLRFLTKRYNIPREFLPTDKRYIATKDVLNFKGIVSHVNYRESGKWDIGQAFDWDTVINGVKAATYTPTTPVPKSLELGLTTEEEIEAMFPKKKGLFDEEETETTDNEGYDPHNFD